MATHQYKDLPLIPHSMDEAGYTNWGAEQHYVQSYKHGAHFGLDDEMYLEAFDNGMVMDRFMHEPYPITHGVLHAKFPVQRQFEFHYEPQWPSADGYRNVSPDRTSSGSGKSSQATQNDLCSPHVYHPVPYGSPTELFSQTLPYPTVEHFADGGYLSSTPLDGGNVNLRQLEYEHHEVEPAMEDIESVELKQDEVCEHDTGVVSIDTKCDDHRDYADSGIGNSVRDAESVQPIDEHEDPASDSDYKPSSPRSSKRRRSIASTNSQSKVSKRKGSPRKDSQDSSRTNSPKTTRKPRRASNAKKVVVEVDDDRRPFPCPFAGYGCISTFSSKNEWKRHVSTQHIKAGFWRCDLCLPTNDPNDDRTFYYNDFNRKDLFTQHLRRMHAAPKDNTSRSTKEFPVNEDNLTEIQTRCLLTRRTPPQQSGCLFCPKTFAGPSSWDERMEHIGRHLEKDRGSDFNVLDVKTWNEDRSLEKYMLIEGLIVRENGTWKIGDGKSKREADDDSDVNAEAE